ncbi:hypothetical protein U9M48_000026 [Paspalum notatum var. saurae]|uniref:Uncharacterized protein n=1 Tax=Paspalum notatum var. saurae TaxID=547442 RepID=A0AAQ3PGA7_PASNO
MTSRTTSSPGRPVRGSRAGATLKDARGGVYSFAATRSRCLFYLLNYRPASRSIAEIRHVIK